MWVGRTRQSPGVRWVDVSRWPLLGSTRHGLLGLVSSIRRRGTVLMLHLPFANERQPHEPRACRGWSTSRVTRWFSDEFPAGHGELVKRTTGVFVANDFECYAASCALLGDADLRSFLSSFQMPVAIVVGDEDYATPVAMAQQLHDAISQSTLTILPSARHLTPIERPGEIASELLALLRRA